MFQEDILTRSKDGSEEIQRVLEITDISEADGGEYACAATNDLGSTFSDPIVINVTCTKTHEEYIHKCLPPLHDLCMIL